MEPKKILNELKRNKLIDDKFIFVYGIIPSNGGSLATSLSGEIAVSLKSDELVFTPIKSDRLIAQEAKSYNKVNLQRIEYKGLFSKYMTFIFSRGQYVKIKISKLFDYNARKIIQKTAKEY